MRLLQGGVSDFSQSQGSAASQTNQRPTTAHNSAAGTGGRLSESTQKKKREKKGKEQLPVPKESSPLTKEKCVHSPPSTFCVPGKDLCVCFEYEFLYPRLVHNIHLH